MSGTDGASAGGEDLDDVVDAVDHENVSIPGGELDLGESTYAVRVPGEVDDPLAVADFVIEAPDVGRIEPSVSKLIQDVRARAELTAAAPFPYLEEPTADLAAGEQPEERP